MSGIEAVFFDCDGTLVDSEVICSRAYVAMFQEFGITLDLDEVFKRFEPFNVQAILNGHFHGYTEGKWRQSWITTNRCCSRYRVNTDGHAAKGWFVCEARDGQIRRRAVDFAE